MDTHVWLDASKPAQGNLSDLSDYRAGIFMRYMHTERRERLYVPATPPTFSGVLLVGDVSASKIKSTGQVVLSDLNLQPDFADW
jgi:hypothetical protein